jgi:hypothetical protein
MTIRIYIYPGAQAATVVSVHGWIEGEDESQELLRVVRDMRLPVVLDLGELSSADPSGLSALTDLASEGFKLNQASDFIKLLLESGGFSPPISVSESNGGTR